ncbi:MAG: family 10 glycosylhydrolase [Candidatus Marinimicrobia bacterium]|nr:family 10 glycosylhydrolase [Candidatus Neomarinimicrobiota bacterium]MBL7046380.1 family 10 glycosylhydrolase [Candidatus Neomarinimicrobiota bacterium]
MDRINKAAYFVAFFIILQLRLFAGENDRHFSFRSIWIVRSSMISEEEIDKALIFAKKNQFNHVFVQVRGRGDAFYKSSIVPRTYLVRNLLFDPLSYAIQKGHQLGLQVHAWMNVYLLWSSIQNPISQKHLLIQHPEWVDKSLLSELKTEINPEYPNNGNDCKYLSPLVPESQTYLLTVLQEVLENYNCDGLHLDYVRFCDIEYGYNSIGCGKFENEHGVDPLELFTKGNQTLSGTKLDHFRNLWNQYRRDAVTDLIRQCGNLVLSIKPSCILSVAVKPDLEEAKKRYYQEWDRWLAEGLVDYVVPMNYDPSLRKFAHNIDIIHDNIPSKYLPGIVMGIATYNQDALDARDKVRYTKVTGFSGISVFSYDSHKNNLDFFTPVIIDINQ